MKALLPTAQLTTGDALASLLSRRGTGILRQAGASPSQKENGRRSGNKAKAPRYLI
ncbi:MAG: hypothetical protein KME50_29230 [Nostoc desertorum CM1-VF14]|nr:hypothetical protein [Nostoc desertorum CM1-VF14]